MTDAISSDEYQDEVDENAGRLTEPALDAVSAGDYGHPHAAALDLASDVLDGHNWFARDVHGASLYGSIIEHSEADPARYSDWQALAESDNPTETVRRIAYCAFEADVISVARELLDNHEAQEALADALPGEDSHADSGE